MSRQNLLLVISVLSFAFAKAQSSVPYQEIGVFFGPVFFQGDFGERGTLENTTKNVGYSAGLSYYLSLNVSRGHNLKENFKLKLDVSYTAVTLNHYGPSASKNSDFGEKLRAMESDVKIGTVGAQLEFYPFKTDDYSGRALNPFAGFGVQANNYNAKVSSSLGRVGSLNTVPPKYVDGFKTTNGVAVSITGVLGMRYKINSTSGITLEGQIKYYFSDWIEGMNPDRRTYNENKTNDFSGIIYVGYVYYLE